MRKLVITLYSILVRMVFLVIGTKASTNMQNTFIDCNYNKPLSFIQDKNIGHTALNSLVQDNNKPIDLSINQSVETKRPAQKIDKSPQCTKKTKKSDSIDDLYMGKKIKINLNAWNKSKLNNRHREGLHFGYNPAIAFYKIGNNVYKNIGDETHQLKIKEYARHCKTLFSEIPTYNEILFVFASRTTHMSTKIEDFKAMDMYPSNYKYLEELNGYYPKLPNDILRYMNNHGPLLTDVSQIKTEWTETLGDIYVRMPIELNYAMHQESITHKSNSKYGLLAAALHMIISLPEVHKDLSNLSLQFIKTILKEKVASNHLAVITALREIATKHKNLKISDLNKQYAILCNQFTDIIQNEYVSPESMVIYLYTEIYKSLTYFYKKAGVCAEILDSKRKTRMGRKEYYMLEGKCIIKPQRYFKCTTTIDLNKREVCENKHTITEETNKWSISHYVHCHYHIHYVENAKQQYKRLCMPICFGMIHTIDHIIQYIKKIYSIEKDKCICPYKRNSSGYWGYIRKEDRNKTVNEFENCYIVFYYIEEGPIDGYFTFAELKSFKKPERSALPIPLFLSPLMRSAIDMGPFKEENMTKHTVVGTMQFMNIQPDVYIYKKEYKTIKYSFVRHYYSNLYIRIDNADTQTINCYIMDSKAIISKDTVTVEWYVKAPSSVNAYTHCILSNELVTDQKKYNAFIEAVKSQEYAPDCILYGYGLQSSVEKTFAFASNDLDYGAGPSIDQKDIIKLNIIPMHKVSINPKIDAIQYILDELDREIKHINKMKKKPEITKKQKQALKKEGKSINMMKCKRKQKIKNMQSQDQLSMKKEFNIAPFPPCSFLVFRNSNARTKSELGAHNEILDAFSRRYNIYNPNIK